MLKVNHTTGPTDARPWSFPCWPPPKKKWTYVWAVLWLTLKLISHMTQEATTTSIVSILLSAQSTETRLVVFHLCLPARQGLETRTLLTICHCKRVPLLLLSKNLHTYWVFSASSCLSSYQKAFSPLKNTANCAASIPALPSKEMRWTGMNFGCIQCDICSTEYIW